MPKFTGFNQKDIVTKNLIDGAASCVFCHRDLTPDVVLHGAGLGIDHHLSIHLARFMRTLLSTDEIRRAFYDFNNKEYLYALMTKGAFK